MTGASRRQLLTLNDWRELPPAQMAPLYQAEVERWSSLLDWDTASAWDHVERGRRLGTVSGLVATTGEDAIAGWMYYLVHKGSLQIGGLNAISEDATRIMLDAVLDGRALARVDAVVLFAFPEAPGLAASLRARGFATNRYEYLSRRLTTDAPSPSADVRRWAIDDVRATAALFGRAYAGHDEARPFAPGGTADEWCEYVLQLTCGDGCGSLLPDACVCTPGDAGQLHGVAIVTRIAADTAHLAQLAIDPSVQGQRRGGRLLAAASAAAARAGHRRITLLVDGRNTRARALYRSAGFGSRGTFVSAGLRQPRRSTSVAPGTAAITRR